MNKTIWTVIIAIIVIVLLTIAHFFKPSFDTSTLPGGDSSRDDARIKETIRQMLEEYKIRNQELFEELKRKLNSAGDSDFNKAKANINPFVEDVTSFTYCSKLCYAIAKDNIFDTKTAMDMIAPRISSMVVRPCEEGQLKVISTLNDSLLKLQENDTQFKAGLASLLEKENFSVLDLGLRDDFLNRNMELAGKMESFAMNKMFLAAGVAIDAILIKSTYKMICTATAAIVKRLAGSLAAGGACAVADGPLPIGDILGGVITIGGTAWTAYDIYNVTKTLPDEMRTYMTSMVNGYERDIRLKALERAEEVLLLCNESCHEIRKAVE